MKFKPVFATLFFLIPLIAVSAQKPAIVFSTQEEIGAEVALAPCKKRNERLAAVNELFLKKGAAESDISIEKVDDTENLVVTKKGSTGEIVIVGAHYDKSGDGCGAIDNWTGIVIVANLYRTFRTLDTKKTYVFIAFDKEELGMLGSKAMAESIKKEDRQKYCAMVNFDSFGFAFPQAMANISTGSLMNLAEQASNDMKIPFSKAIVEGANSDSEPYRRRGIPAISLHGLDNRWKTFLHSSRDKVESIDTGSVYLGYRHGLVLLSKVENGACADLRK